MSVIASERMRRFRATDQALQTRRDLVTSVILSSATFRTLLSATQDELESGTF